MEFIKNNKGKLAAIVAIILALLIIIISVALIGKKDKDEPASSSDKTTSISSDETSMTDITDSETTSATSESETSSTTSITTATETSSASSSDSSKATTTTSAKSTEPTAPKGGWVDGNSNDWKINKDTHTLVEFIGKAPADGILIVPNRVNGVAMKTIGEECITDNKYDKNIRTLKISEGIERIVMYAVVDCYNLEKIVFPSSLVKYEEHAFVIEKVKEISIGNSNYFVCQNNILYSKDKKVAYLAANFNNNTTYVMPKEVTTIGKGFMQANQSITSITLSSNVKEIHDFAFNASYTLTSIVIPDGLKTIGKNVISSCWYLTDITIPSSVTSIGDGSFYSLQISKVTFHLKKDSYADTWVKNKYPSATIVYD